MYDLANICSAMKVNVLFRSTHVNVMAGIFHSSNKITSFTATSAANLSSELTDKYLNHIATNCRYKMKPTIITSFISTFLQ
jgi:hypothetical protein